MKGRIGRLHQGIQPVPSISCTSPWLGFYPQTVETLPQLCEVVFSSIGRMRKEKGLVMITQEVAELRFTPRCLIPKSRFFCPAGVNKSFKM